MKHISEQDQVTTEDIRECMKQLIDAGIARGIGGHTQPVGYVGGGLYRIADGVYGGKNAWDAFEKELLRQGMKFVKKKNHHRKVKRK